MRSLTLVLTLFFATSSTAALQAQDKPDRYREQLQPVIERALREMEVPGLAIAVVEDQKIAYSAAFGVKSLARKDDPVTTETLFHMASITKPRRAQANRDIRRGARRKADKMMRDL